ncbi:alpha/beta hydrolase (plasmid) [Burkholderia sp. JSH-S8]|nr:alpha/beta hydrolase [Burkholderia sp. JSH-S8]
MDSGRCLPGTPRLMHYWRCADGVRLAGDIRGNPDGLPVARCTAADKCGPRWGDTGERLGAAGCFAVAFDARGHGNSDRSPDDDYSTDALVRDLDGLVKNGRLGQDSAYR